MKYILLLFFVSLLTIINGTYNPIPIGSVIISTESRILVMQPAEYGGNDQLVPIYTAVSNMTIVNSIYDTTARTLYIIFLNASVASNGTNSSLYLSQLISLELIDSTVYQLPISFDKTNINQLNSFTSDVINRRAFLTDNLGEVKLFSMSGLMETMIPSPTSITAPIRSVAYSDILNQLIVITDTTAYTCTNFDSNTLQCCQPPVQLSQLRSIAFDLMSPDSAAYVLDQSTGIYEVLLNAAGCPTGLLLINRLGVYSNLHFAIDRGLYFASASIQNGNENSILVIANGTNDPRPIPIGIAIVQLHISYPNTASTGEITETCFHGITYNDYRVAVLLAAIFGTIMGIFMCFNALFCIDFFMTKRIIRNLKQQIPHNLLEDRWNKLVEEKYAKLALEKQRKKDDPPPRRLSSTAARKNSTSAPAGNDDSKQGSGGGTSGGGEGGLQVPNPIPKLSAYLRRKSESYVSRRRSEDYRNQRSPDESKESRPPQPRTTTTAQIHEPLHEETEHHHSKGALRQNLSQRQLIDVDDEAFL